MEVFTINYINLAYVYVIKYVNFMLQNKIVHVNNDSVIIKIGPQDPTACGLRASCTFLTMKLAKVNPALWQTRLFFSFNDNNSTKQNKQTNTK